MKYLIFCLVFLVACQPSENLEDHICVDNCLRIEGTITDGSTNEPISNLSLVLEVSSTVSRIAKARLKTDANGSYSTSIEVSDDELASNSRYFLKVENEDEVFSTNSNSNFFTVLSNQVKINIIYIQNFVFHRPAFVKYDMDGLSKLKEDEKIELKLNYEYETKFGSRKNGKTTRFTYGWPNDEGLLEVPAGIPISVVVTYFEEDGNEKVLRDEVLNSLEYNEEYELEVGI